MNTLPELATRASVYAAGVLVIIALVEALKRLWKLPDRWAFVAALVIGEAFAWGAYLAYPDPPQHFALTTIYGLMLGLMASGAYSGVRATAQV